jgi:CRP-like cAMP-binding protein
MAILAQSPRTANCIAVIDVTALKIEREQFVELLRIKPELALGIIQTLVQRLKKVSQKVVC